MNTKDRMKLLKEWESQFHLINETWTELKKRFRGLDCDSRVGRAIWGTFEKYTTALSAQIGDNGSWLDWYCWDNDMGAKSSKAKASSWKRMKTIKTLKDLCKIIEADI